MSFFGNLLNSIPVVGHVKGLIHYVCNDEEGGDRAMLSATRTVAVVGAVTAGALAGPVGAIAAGATAGAYYDTGVAIATDGKHVNGVAKIIEKPGEISSWVGAGIDVVGDGLCGVGAGLNNVAKEAGKTVAKQGARQVLKQEANIAAKAVAMDLTFRAAKHAAAATDAAMQNGQGNSSARETSNNSSGNQQQQRRTENSNQGGGRDPDDRRNGSEKKKECQGATMEQLKEFIRIVEKIEELMQKLSRGFMSAADFRNKINQLYREFISAAMPLMNDPTIRLRINSNGGLEIITASGNQVGISRHQANLLSRGIHEALGNTSGINRPCTRSSCRFCPNLRELQSGLIGNCDTTGVIYSFYCKDCRRIVYAGQTTQPLRNRMTHHLNFEGSPLRHHMANNPGHRNASDLLNNFDINIMWKRDGVDTELEDSSIKRIIRNWEVFFQWLSEAHKSLGGESKK
uniref:GIY-YIG domain-containing protein n=1 Tax=Daphnia galeata TaxID=27404 RepID=A0A8J2RR06_9CRUS|nr:unnamed protein product [Daphnia galeata]